jgi:hypothetical protein
MSSKDATVGPSHVIATVAGRLLLRIIIMMEPSMVIIAGQETIDISKQYGT